MKMNTRSRGFSLVELIVVIAILAVLVAVLAPSLIRYTEDSRAQKDISAMDELVNAVQLALASDKCYDEALEYSVENNFITYTDSSAEYGVCIADEEFWAPTGTGKATTITFNPELREDGKTIYRLSNAIVNDMTYGNGSVAVERTMDGAKMDDNQCYFSAMDLLYNQVRLTVGDTLTPTSTTYKNSSFTIFITFSQKDGVTVAEVNGAFNGTNLHDGCQAASGTGEAGAVDAEYSNTNLSGGGLPESIPSYKQDVFLDNLQKDNTFEYYSSAALAAQDISNNTIGQNADAARDQAVAGIFIDEDAIPNLVILKDTVETNRILFTCKANLILGGHKIVAQDSIAGSNANVAVQFHNGGLIDGRIDGSQIILSPQAKTATYNLIQCLGTGDCEIIGGKYTFDKICPYGTLVAVFQNVSSLTVKQAKMSLNLEQCEPYISTDLNFCNIISMQGDIPATLLVEDSELTGTIVSASPSGMTSLNGINMRHATTTIRRCKFEFRYADGVSYAFLNAIRVRDGSTISMSQTYVYSDSAAIKWNDDAAPGSTLSNDCTIIGNIENRK